MYLPFHRPTYEDKLCIVEYIKMDNDTIEKAFKICDIHGHGKLDDKDVIKAMQSMSTDIPEGFIKEHLNKVNVRTFTIKKVVVCI